MERGKHPVHPRRRARSVRWSTPCDPDACDAPPCADDDLIELVLDDAAEKMAKAVEHARAEFAAVRTGRATSGARREADRRATTAARCRSSSWPASRCPRPACSSSPRSTRTRSPPSRRAIQTSDLGLNPSNDGRSSGSPSRRSPTSGARSWSGSCEQMAEEGKVALRNLRRAGREELEALEKDGDMSADDLRGAEKRLDEQIHDVRGEDRRGAADQGARAAR